MERLHVLFPEGTKRRLRATKEREDRPMSEIVRRSTEEWLDRRPGGPPWEGPLPVLDLGLRATDPAELKELISRGEQERP